MPFPPTVQQLLDEEQADIVARWHRDHELLKQRAEEDLRRYKVRRRTVLSILAALSGQQTISRLPAQPAKQHA